MEKIRLRTLSERREVGFGAGGSTARAVRSVVEDEVVGSGDEGGDGVGDREI